MVRAEHADRDSADHVLYGLVCSAHFKERRRSAVLIAFPSGRAAHLINGADPHGGADLLGPVLYPRKEELSADRDVCPG